MEQKTNHLMPVPRKRRRNHHWEEEAQAQGESLGQKMQQRLGFRTRIQTPKRHSLTNSFDLNPFTPLKSSSRSRRKRNSITSDSNRKWASTSLDFSALKDKVVVVSYNILGVENASKHSDLYLNVSPKLLEWDRRKKMIRKEMKSYNASILCFQEVDRFDDLDKLFKEDGFRGAYKARTGLANDGCAIFWKKKQFTLLYQASVEFRSYGLRDNVAQFCILKMNQNQTQSDPSKKRSKATFTSRNLLVGNIHMLFNPSRGDIKLGQVRLFLEKAFELSHTWGDIPVILAGDLNSTPQSALYQFLATSELEIRQFERKNISSQLENPRHHRDLRFLNENIDRYPWSDEEIMLAAGRRDATHLRHQLKLLSAYSGVPGSCATRDDYREPLATSYHSRFTGTVDYIWHTKQLVPIKVLETLPLEVLRRSASLPNERWGSDHLALVCELAFTDDNKIE